MAGQMHNLTMQISDANGVNSIDIVTVKLLGVDQDEIGVMNWEPRNGAVYTANNSQLTLHEIITTEGDGDTWSVSWHFTLDWSFDESLIPDYASPAIVVFDDDELNPVALLTNIGNNVRWQLDNNLEVVVENMSDNTPPISIYSSEHIYVQPGDDISFSGSVVYEKSGAVVQNLPQQGLEVSIQTNYGNDLRQAYAEVTEGGNWETSMILPSRSLSEPTIEVDYSITGIPAPGEDKTYLQTLMTVDEKSPIVQFDEAPTPNKNPLDDSNLEVTMFEVVIFEEGGMPEGDLTINWAFKRSGLI